MYFIHFNVLRLQLKLCQSLSFITLMVAQCGICFVKVLKSLILSTYNEGFGIYYAIHTCECISV